MNTKVVTENWKCTMTNYKNSKFCALSIFGDKSSAKFTCYFLKSMGQVVYKTYPFSNRIKLPAFWHNSRLKIYLLICLNNVDDLISLLVINIFSFQIKFANKLLTAAQCALWPIQFNLIKILSPKLMGKLDYIKWLKVPEGWNFCLIKMLPLL